MNNSSRKNKGNRFEIYLVERFRKTIDANTHRQPSSGSGLEKNDIRIPNINIEIEAKNAKNFNLVADWEQTKNQKTTGNMAILAIRHPKQPEFKETVVVVDLEDFITLLENQVEKKEVSFTADKDNKWKIQRLIDSAKIVLKVFDQ